MKVARLRLEQSLSAHGRPEQGILLMGGLTTGSTRPLDSISFMVNYSDNIEWCMLAAGYPGRYASMSILSMKYQGKNWIYFVIPLVVVILTLVSCSTSPPVSRTMQPPKPSKAISQQQTSEPAKTEDTTPAFYFGDKERRAAAKAWQNFIKDGHYRIARAEDFKMPEWTKTVYYSSSIKSAMEYPYCDGDINRDGVHDDFAFIVVDKTRDDTNRFSIVIFNARKDGKGYDAPRWLYRDSDLSRTTLGRSSDGPMHLSQYRDDGDYNFCFVKWDRQEGQYECNRIR